jgi:predicted polyphosphate/ATP-dependent NAD kinase
LITLGVPKLSPIFAYDPPRSGLVQGLFLAQKFRANSAQITDIIAILRPPR